MAINRLYVNDRYTGTGDRTAAAMVHDSPDVYVMMNTILSLYPPERRGAAMGLMGLVIMVALSSGQLCRG
ncbi:hypothetical protein GCM10010918_10630 [Paenibacillus radicis (ex Gao et al. 2016)]|uniref:Uncharacterized protein n=1 Tax=Paenibacillus radicis (ex Gao et al. 2016) TaxID=1737354 RepID=A0A917LUT4_9BACL|nr:hypothetical protein GCM10010918_10630 [Paenibacillus radicis (ex Gao et al. 2016)]